MDIGSTVHATASAVINSCLAGNAVRGTHCKRELLTELCEIPTERQVCGVRVDNIHPDQQRERKVLLRQAEGCAPLRRQRRAAAHHVPLTAALVFPTPTISGAAFSTIDTRFTRTVFRKTLRSSSKDEPVSTNASCTRTESISRARKIAGRRYQQRRLRSQISTLNTRVARGSAIALKHAIVVVSALCGLRSLERGDQRRNTRSI